MCTSTYYEKAKPAKREGFFSSDTYLKQCHYLYYGICIHLHNHILTYYGQAKPAKREGCETPRKDQADES
jgi:hypothetical protein